MNKDEQQALNTKLADAAENQNLGEVVALILAGADVNGKHCLDGCMHTPLIKAAVMGNIPIVTYLLEHGADTSRMGSENKTAETLARENGKIDVVTRLKAFEDDKKPERVSFQTYIGDRVREDIYDFSMKERLTLIRQSRFGTVETATITGFSSIEDQSDASALRKAFNEHVKRGGMTEESEVFVLRVFKAKPGLQRAP
ncbi:MAG: ankyrin repeat domain-containing protein [Alphaproteobacteria bacterium]